MKKRILHLFLFVLLFLCYGPYSHAQVTDTVAVESFETDTSSVVDETYETDEKEATLQPDTLLSPTVVFYHRDSLRRLKNDKNLKYIQRLDSLLLQWQNQQKKEAPSSNNWVLVVQLIKLLLWVFVIGGVLYLIFRLFLSEKGLFAATARKKQLLQHEEEVTDEDTLTARIREAEKAGQFRLAVRYSYLLVLHTIAGKGWLHLSPDKTNYQYLRELSNKSIRNDFARITLHYEYAWYGNFEVDTATYQTIQKEFQQFQSRLKS